MAGSEKRWGLCFKIARPRTTLRASDASPPPNEDVIYTARVTPTYLGPIVPSGTVRFQQAAYPDPADAPEPIPFCEARPLAPEGGSGVATCTASYATPGRHEIIATYSGDHDFAGSEYFPDTEGESSERLVVDVRPYGEAAPPSGEAPPAAPTLAPSLPPAAIVPPPSAMTPSASAPGEIRAEPAAHHKQCKRHGRHRCPKASKKRHKSHKSARR
jgi:hypothetical protein